ncbi:MAG: hypothetical protein SP4CHLAM5_07200 [Chlamydiia bacterium]|nr:hypothetical protein [Chlamydiia bacterium]MCH9618587.1 hypothetical protein [Chlamydiia bacterium]MCH9623874.1 hypothetical protein [Chlamydiia bacterium]
MTLLNFLALNEKLSLLEPEKKAHLISYLSTRARENIESPAFPQKTLQVPMTTQKIVKRVDISHFKHYLDKLPVKEKLFYVTAFPKYKQVDLTGPDTIYKEYETEAFSAFVLGMLFKKALPAFPPPGIIPFHPILELLSDTGVPLSKVVHFLGLIDVVLEVKKIISRATLKELQKAFDKEQIAFMNLLSGKDNLSPLTSMNLASYKGDKQMLYTLIEERGKYRFAQAIKDAPVQYHFFFTYFLPKQMSDNINALLKQQAHLAANYRGWENDSLTTWRFLCTCSP